MIPTFWSRGGWERCTGRPAPPDLYAVERDDYGTLHTITYTEHMASKRERQTRILKTHRKPREQWEAWLFSVRWSPGLGKERLYEGYHAWLHRAGRERVWVRGMAMYHIRQLLPLGLLPLESDAAWKAAFLKAYRVGTRNGRPWGARVVWLRGYEMALAAPRVAERPKGDAK